MDDEYLNYEDLKRIIEQMTNEGKFGMGAVFIGGEDVMDFFSNVLNIKDILPDGLNEKDKPDMDRFKQGVIGHKDAVFAQKDPELHKVYIRACLSVDNLALAYEALTTLAVNPSAKEKELMGLVAYKMGDNRAALEHFEGINPSTSEARLVHSSLLHKERTKYQPQDHIKRLQKDLNHSSAANTFLGILYFNIQKFEDARKHFHKAVNLGEDSEYKVLNLLTAVYASGEQANAHANAIAFRNRSGTKLSIEQITDQLQRKYIPVPAVSMEQNFYQVARALL